MGLLEADLRHQVVQRGATYVVTLADVNAGVINNTGVVTGTPPAGQEVTDNDPLSEPVAQNPGISIVKSSNATGTNVVGDTITYSYLVTNTGNVTLTNVTVTDVHVGLSAITCLPAQGSSLVPSSTMTCTAPYVVTLADVNAGEINNTGVVTGTPPGGPDVTADEVANLWAQINTITQNRGFDAGKANYKTSYEF